MLLPLLDQADIVVIALRERDLITEDMVGRGVAVITGGQITFDLADCRASHIALHSSVGAMATAMLARQHCMRRNRYFKGTADFLERGALEATFIPVLTRSDWRVTE